MHVGIEKRSVTRAGHLAVSAGRTARLACIARFNHKSKVTGLDLSIWSLTESRADRTAQMIIDELRDLKGGLAGLTHMQGEFRQILDSVREEMKVFRQERTVPVDNLRGSFSLNIGPGVPEERDDVKPVRQAVEQNEQKVPMREIEQQRPPQQMQSISRTASYEEEERRPEAVLGEVVSEVVGDVGELSIPIEHTTAAQKLLRWPSIQELFSRNQTSYNENYVMVLEETRGLLRVYGRGEGGDLGDGGQPGPSSPAPSATSVRSEDQAFSPTTPPEGLWGTGFGSPISGDPKRTLHEGIGGLTPDGTLKIDPQTCVGLLKSYMDNLHILHPFLDKNRLTRMVDRFAKRYNPSEYPSIRSPFATSNNVVPGEIRRDSTATLHKAMKRKHSTSTTSGPPTDSSSGGGSSSSGTVYRPLLERSITTVLVLLVLALGKICEWKDPLPGPVPDGTQHPRQPPYHSSYSPLSMQVDSPMPGTMRQSPTPSQSSIYRTVTSPSTGLRFGRMSRRSSNEGLSSFEKGLKNADVIPGLAYYAYATDILGNLHGGNELTYIQANLLAGLYAGQLARVFESWSWINSACRACQVLVRPGKLNMEASDPYTDLVKFTFWTCVQLESDILAELDLPASGITRYEQLYSTNHPKGVTLGDWTNPQQNEMMIYYSAQVQLRVILNRVHSLLYQMEKTNPKHAGWSTRWCRELDHQLESWRSILPAEYQWSDSDPPSSDINAARMRAKYYGARYLIHRPFLHHALHPISHQNMPNTQLSESPSTGSTQTSHHASMPDTPTTAHQSIRRGSRMGPPRLLNIDRIDKQVLQASEICVKAAIQSTIAFDGVHKRPIVTNIFGTAHA